MDLILANIRPFNPNAMIYGALPHPPWNAPDFFDAAHVPPGGAMTPGSIRIKAVNRATRFHADRRRRDRVITFGDFHGLNDSQINILYHDTFGVTRPHYLLVQPPLYDQVMDIMVMENKLFFDTMRDLYFFLLHLVPNSRRFVRSIRILDITSGPYVKQGIQLLKQCTGLRQLEIDLCRYCAEVRCPPAVWWLWRRTARGIGRLSAHPAGLRMRPRPATLPNCTACIALPTQPPPPVYQPPNQPDVRLRRINTLINLLQRP